MLASSSVEVHLLQNRAAQEPVGIGERFAYLKVVITLADEELYRFSRRLNSCGEVTRLTLEFRGLERAVRNDDWSTELVEMAVGSTPVPSRP